MAEQFKVVGQFRPAGDQPQAIESLADGVKQGIRYQTLLGVTGSGKTATMAWVIESVQRPTLIIEPNKSLAAQLSSELRMLMPHNRVEYFVSYYDYYQPEAYLPTSDLYIEKDSSLNEDIDRLRHSATSALLLRNDVVVVASVSCIYGLGSPQEYRDNMVALTVGSTVDQRELLRGFVRLHYRRNDIDLSRGRFRVRGDIIELHPSYEEYGIRIELFGDEVTSIKRFDTVTGSALGSLDDIVLLPATHYIAGEERLKKAITSIEAELGERLRQFKAEGKLLEAQRLKMRTEHDLEMLAEVGSCSGIENYSRHLDGREAGEPPYTLLDYFPPDMLVVADESHVAIPQLHGQFVGDRSRKLTLVEHGFRLPSALDNRPLTFDEFVGKVPQMIFMSATPSQYELEVSGRVVEQVIRPTGLVDPEITIHPTTGQIDDLRERLTSAVAASQRALITTLTKKMAEQLTEYLSEAGFRVRYMHSDIDTIERIDTIRDLRLGEFDILVGINLLREGLDLPEVALVAILDADKEGFLRSGSSLIQTIGRAARNVDGKVVLYADTITGAMRQAIQETDRRRSIQKAYNEEHGINPVTVHKAVSDILDSMRSTQVASGTGVRAGRNAHGRKAGPKVPARGGRLTLDALDADVSPLGATSGDDSDSVGGKVKLSDGMRNMAGAIPLSIPLELEARLELLEREMQRAASELRYEEAAAIRDEIFEIHRDIAMEIERTGEIGVTEKTTAGSSRD